MRPPRLRKPRFARSPLSLPVVLTKRDIRILSLAQHHRFIQSHHLAALLAGSRQHLVRRLGRLYHAGYLERPRCQLLLRDRIAPHFVYCLSRQGLKALREHSDIPYGDVPRLKAASSALSLCHALRVTDILAALEAQAAACSVHVLPHREWPQDSNQRNQSLRYQLRWSVSLTHDGEHLKTSILPDGAVALQVRDEPPSYFILEADRGTMPLARRGLTQSSLRRKILAYQEIRRAGVLWKRFQVPGFRVLFVVESARRLAALQAVTAACFKRGESGMFLFAVASEFLAAPDALRHPWLTCSGKVVRLLPPSCPDLDSAHGVTDGCST